MSQYISFLLLKPVRVRFLASVPNRVLINIRVIREGRKKRRRECASPGKRSCSDTFEKCNVEKKNVREKKTDLIHH